MGIPKVYQFLVIFCLHMRLNFAAWTPKTFPNPTTEVDSCGRKGVKSWICDPDGVLSYESANVVEGIIKDIQAGHSPYVLAPCGSDGPKGYQVAVAVMRKMGISGDSADAAKDFAVSLHDRWGVGDKSCNNGVLVLLAVDDRQLYISTGTGAAQRLTYDVLGNIIDDVRPLLKQQKYDDAVEGVAVDIGLALAGHDVEPKHSNATWDDFVALGIFISAVGGLIFVTRRREARRQKRYQDCKSKLEKLKRDQAAMRANTYNPTSCPVCLEDFEDASSTGESSASVTADPGKGADDPIASTAGLVAGCGDDLEDELRQPLVPGDVTSRGTGPGLELTGTATTGSAATTAEAAAAAAGSVVEKAAAAAQQPPRRPLVLPCGHAFCEPCITMWLEQKKVTCPICRKPFDEEDATLADVPDAALPRPASRRDDSSNSNHQDRGNGTADAGAGPSTSRPPCTADEEDWEQEQMRDAGASTAAGEYGGSAGEPRLRLRWRNNGRRRYQMPQDLLLMEMLFRLRQLQQQHPDYVTPSMAHSWEQDMQNGRELSAQQLRQFQLSDPALRRAHEASGSRGTSVSFGGGGGGGGGRGGSW